MPTPAADLYFHPTLQIWIKSPAEGWPDIMAPTSPDPLEDAGFRLSAWSPADAPALAALLSDESLWQYLPEPYPGTLDADAARALISAANASPSRDIVRALRQGDEGVGQVRLTLTPCGRVGEISYWLGRGLRGRGLGGLLLRAGAARAFAHLPGLLKLTARVHAANTASRKLLDRVGFLPFRREGDWTWMKLRRAL